MKICNRCKKELQESEFGQYSKPKSGLKAKCKKCDSEVSMISYWKKRDSRVLHMKKYREKNPDILKNAAKKWQDKNKEYSRAKAKERYHKKKTDPKYKIPRILRARLGMAIKKIHKSSSSVVLLGCSIEQCRLHIESLFQPGMTWENHGNNGWHVDHIIPCAAFDLTDPEQQKLCFHYTNLQPLWAEENRKKWDKICTK
jgi:hypothetical protein